MSRVASLASSGARNKMFVAQGAKEVCCGYNEVTMVSTTLEGRLRCGVDRADLVCHEILGTRMTRPNPVFDEGLVAAPVAKVIDGEPSEGAIGEGERDGLSARRAPLQTYR